MSMRLAAGDRLGAYEIVTLLGAGGMGEVYRARDSRLGREVAVKVLPASIGEHADRLRRFEQEARATGALNHPNILVVYDVGSDGDTRYVVSELLEGATLGSKVAAGPLPLAKCLDYAIQIARGLAAAHAKGIVHRDLKPENLFITHDGRVKILDFGLAKLTRPGSDPDVGRDATVSTMSPKTTPGAILGTVGYMAPEQIRDFTADHRSDIFSFGVIFFEMLFGRRAFKADTAAETMAAILRQDPLEPSSGERGLPPGVERILRHCLEKSPDERFQSSRDLAFHLEAVAGRSDTVAPVARAAGRGRVALWTMAAFLAGGLIAWIGLRSMTRPAPGGITRFTVAMPPGVRFGDSMTLSRDGKILVYTGIDETGSRLYKRALDTLESVPIRGTEGGGSPFLSPDGISVGFAADLDLKRVPLQGGSPVTLSETVGAEGGTWLSDDTIVFHSDRGLMRVPASGGETRPVTVLNKERGEGSHFWPIALPGDRAVVFTVHYGARDSQAIEIVSLQSGERTTLAQGNGAHVLPDGEIVFQRGGSLWTARFDDKQLRLTGVPIEVLEGIKLSTAWQPVMAVGANGSMAYATGGAEPFPARALFWVDRTGREEPIDAPPRSWWWPQISPDGKRLGFHIMDPGNMDAWIYELDHGPLIKMTFHPLQDGYPLWSPDGKRIAFWSRQGGGVADLYLRSADLTGRDQRLTERPNPQEPFAWADDGKLLVFQEYSPDTKMDIGVLPIDGAHTPTFLLHGPSDEGHPAMSADGRWLAYQSDVSGRWEVYVQPYPDLAGRWQVSTQGGESPIWHPNGRELFYRDGRAMMSVPVTPAGNTFTYGNPRLLFEGSYVPEGFDSFSARSYALHPDGQRFLMMKEGVSAQTTQIVVVLNWAEELKRRLSAH